MGNFYWKLINNQQDIPYTAGPKREGMPFSGMIKLKLLKVCRIKSIKSIKIFSFILKFIFKFLK